MSTGQYDASIDVNPYERAILQNPSGDRKLDLLVIFKILKEKLRQPVEEHTKALRLKETIQYLVCEAEELGGDFRNTLTSIWEVYFGIIRYVPPGHPWFRAMAICMELLVSCEMPISKNAEKQGVAWEDISSTMDDILVPFFKGHHPWGDWSTETEKTQLSLNLVSFAACMCAGFNDRPPHFGVLAIRDALEEPLAAGPAMQQQLWMATEWLLYAAEPIHLFMATGATQEWVGCIIHLDMCDAAVQRETAKVVYARGSFAVVGEVESELSISRWAFWKRRLIQIAGEADLRQLEGGIVPRLRAAVNVMKMVESRDRVQCEVDRGVRKWRLYDPESRLVSLMGFTE